jgi:flagellar hook assembly protein FlgD
LFTLSSNPLTSDSEIRYTLENQMPVNIAIYDLSGRKITQLVGEIQNAGYHSIKLNGLNRISNTMCIIRITAGSHSEVKKAIVK